MANSDVKLKEVAISVESAIKNLLDLVEEGRNRGSELQPSISMVPKRYRDQNPRCFDPQVVSIGPLHKGHENVKKNDGLKKAYMHDLLARLNSSSQEMTLESCFLKVNSSINQIKLCYGGLNNYHDFDVAIMMVTDACFILEFIQKILVRERILIWGNTFTFNSICTDLLLIKNQIPFFVLQDIFDLTLRKIQQNRSLVTLLLDSILCEFNPFKAKLKIDDKISLDNFKHILDILHKSCRSHVLPPEPITHSDVEHNSPELISSHSNPENISHSNPDNISHSVVELDRAGVKFKPNQGGNMAMSMENESFGWLQIFRYFRKLTLSMPVLTIDDHTELLLRNLIAYEQSFPNVDGYYFTSFAVTMDMFVNSTKDVVKLVESKVIVNCLGSNEDAAKMINSICSEVTYMTFMYIKEFQQLDTYYNSSWPKHMARLRRRYFNSPWSAIALVAGILLFALTAIQTIFTIISV